MKKIILAGMLILLLIMPIVVAGERHRVSFDEGPVFIEVPLRDLISFDAEVRQYYEPQDIGENTIFQFEYVNQTQAILLEEIRNIDGQNKVKLAVFLEDSKFPYYSVVGARDSIRLDYEFDEVEELVIQVLSVSEDKATFLLVPLEPEGEYIPHVFNLGKAQPIITGTNETESDNSITGRITSAIQDGSNTQRTIGALIILVLLILIFKRPIQKILVKSRNERFKAEERKTETKEEKVEEVKMGENEESTENQ